MEGEITGVDEVSGNEVPLGSTPEEVRDDVDAKLSVNEFVMPADAVRYFGVRFFEDLIKEAKVGWQRLKEEGRLGNDDDDDDFPFSDDDDFPFSDEELMTEPQEEPTFAEGGAVTEPGLDLNTYNGGPYGGVGSTFLSGNTGGVTTKKYVNAQGNTTYLLFINGQPSGSVPEGYLEDTPENREKLRKESSPAPTTEGTRDSGNTSYEANRNPTAGKSQTTASGPKSQSKKSSLDGIDTAEGLGKYAKEALKTSLPERLASGAGAILGGVVAGPYGALAGRALGTGLTAKASISDALAAAAKAEALGYNDVATKTIAAAETTYGNLGKAYTTVMPSFEDMLANARSIYGAKAPTVNPASMSGRLMSDQQISDRISGMSRGDDFGRSDFGSDADFNRAAEMNAPRGMSWDGDSGSYSRSGSAAPSSSPRPQSNPNRSSNTSSKSSTPSSSGKSSTSSSSSKSSSSGGWGKDDTDRGRAKGGLITKPDRKPRKRKVKILDK